MENLIQEWSQGPALWLVVGLVLLILEFLAPGLVLVFFGMGALVTGLLLLMVDMSVSMQIVVFLVASVVFLFSLRKMSKPILYGESSEDPNKEEVVGQRARVTEAIAPPEVGKVELNGAEWRATSDDAIAVGTPVEITTRDNLTLRVKPLH